MTDEWTITKLRQIKDAAQQSCEFADGLNEADFLADDRTHKACSLNLIIIGEAAKRIAEHDPSLAEANPDIPWHYMTGMRNHIAHGYEKIDLGRVWKTVSEFLPELIAQIDALLSQ